jgi:hypothetical protein
MGVAWRGEIEAAEPARRRSRASKSLLARPQSPPERGAAAAGARLAPSGSASSVHSQAQEMSYPQASPGVARAIGAIFGSGLAVHGAERTRPSGLHHRRPPRVQVVE